MRYLLNVVSYMHTIGIVHRDIRLENLYLISHKGKMHENLRLADFGKSTLLEADEFLDEKLGVAYYMAPEIFGSQFSHKTDVWACGVIAYMLISGRPPFNGETEAEIMRKARDGYISFIAPVFKEVS